MFIFVLPALVVTTGAALFSVTGGANFIIAALAAMESQRRAGYKGGEGWLSEREAGTYYSTSFDKNSDHDLSSWLGRIAAQAPTLFSPFVGKKYDLTKSEGQLLRSIVQPAVVALNELEGIKIAIEQDPRNEELQQLLFASIDNFSMLVNPIVVFLEQFPPKRTKKV